MDKKATTIGKGVRIGAVALIPIAYFLLTYNGKWWTPLAASVLIVLLTSLGRVQKQVCTFGAQPPWTMRENAKLFLNSYLAWPKRGLDAVGLRIPLAQIGISLLILCIVAVAAHRTIPVIAAHENIVFISAWERKKWTSLAHTTGQTLNEEMVLGALLLKLIRRKSKSAHPCVTSTAVALTFSLAHYLFYYARPSESWNYGTLSTATLTSLFAIGVVRNNCILSTGNVGYAWALHLGWNAVFINSRYLWQDSYTRLAEPAIFNAILGNTTMVAISLTLMGLSFLLFLKKRMPVKALHTLSTQIDAPSHVAEK